MSFAGFTATAVYAENTSEHDRTTHLGYVFDFEGITIYHSGDTRKDPDSYLPVSTGPGASLPACSSSRSTKATTTRGSPGR